MKKEHHKIDGRISIVRPATHEKGFIRIELTDADAATRFCNVEMSYEDFAKALTGLCYTPCTVSLHNLNKVGKIHQNKTEIIEYTGDEEKDLAPFKVDGWYPRSGDYKNHHQHFLKDGIEYVRVIFFRHSNNKLKKRR